MGFACADGTVDVEASWIGEVGGNMTVSYHSILLLVLVMVMVILVAINSNEILLQSGQTRDESVLVFVGSETLAGDEALVCYLERGFSHGEFMIYRYHMQVLLHVCIQVPKCKVCM